MLIKFSYERRPIYIIWEGLLSQAKVNVGGKSEKKATAHRR